MRSQSPVDAVEDIENAAGSDIGRRELRRDPSVAAPRDEGSTIRLTPMDAGLRHFAESDQATRVLMNGAAAIRVRLLGPIEVVVGGRAFPPAKPQIRRVLALIGAQPGRAITVDELVDQLWDHRDKPQDPRGAVRSYVSRLRHQAGHDLVKKEPKGSGYMIEPELIDVWHYHRLIHAADRAVTTAEAIGLLEVSQQLWRGSPFGDEWFGERWEVELLSRAVTEINDVRVLANCTHAELLTGTGEPGRAAVLLHADFVAAPHHERLGLALANALAQDGRRPEALAVLEQLSAALLDFGLGVTSAVNELQRMVLDGGVDLRRPTKVERQRSRLPFVGRAAILDQVLASCRSSISSLLVGEPGIGKSALLDVLEARLAATGSSVLHLQVDPDPIRPLAFLADLFGSLVDRGAEIAAPTERSALQRLVSDGSVHSAPTAPLSRSEFKDGLAEFFSRAVSDLGVILVVDDLQFLDSFSAAIVSEVIESGRCCVVGTCRSGEHASPLTGFTASDSMSIINLERLSGADVATYVAALSRRTPKPSLVQSFYNRTGGNPLLLRLLVELDAEGGLGTGGPGVDADGGALPPSIAIAAHKRLDALARGAIETLQVAAAIGTSFDLSTLHTLRPDSGPEIESAVKAQLVTIDAAGQRGKFIHGLVAEAAYNLLPKGKLAEVHDEIGRASELSGVGPTGLVRHYVIAAPLDPIRAIDACIAAGDEHMQHHALEVARSHLLDAVRLCEDYGVEETELAAQVLVLLGSIERLASLPDHVDNLLRGADLSQRLGAHEVFATAVTELSSPGGLTRAGRNDDGVLRLRDTALAAPLSDPSRAVLSASFATLTSLTSEYALGQDLFSSALETVEQLGDPHVEAQVLAHAHLGLSRPEDFDLRQDAARRLSAVAGTDVDLMWEAELLWFWDNLIRAYPVQLRATLDRLRSLTPRARHRQLSLWHIEAAAAQVRGELEAAEEALGRAAVLARASMSESWAMAHQISLLLSIRDAQGRLPEMSAQVDAFAAAAPDFHNWRSAVALVAAEVGDHDKARSILRDLTANRCEVLLHDLTWTATLEALGRVASIVDDVGAASLLYDLLLPFQGRMSWAATCSMGPNDRALGMLARTLGNDDRAEKHFRRADALTNRMRAVDA